MTTNYPQEETQRYVNPNSLSQQESYDYHHFLKRQDPYQRRFSYTSMLSDADPCYLPAVSNSSPSSNHSEDYPSQQHTPPPTSSNPSGMQSFMDYVDLQSKPPVNQQSIYHPTMPYYEAHSKNLLNYDEHYSHRNAMIQMSSQQQQQQNGFSSMCSTPTPHHLSMKQERPMTPVSPPLKDENAAQQSSTIPDKLKRVPRSRGRRVSNVPGCGTRMFTCKADGCGKVFKRSEHLKRHIRSIHTLEKPFECPYQSCNKRFSRSDNLNQHIRIHRHSTSHGPTTATHKDKDTGLRKHKQQPISLSTHQKSEQSFQTSYHYNNSNFSNFI